jgi:hypothetical protein
MGALGETCPVPVAWCGRVPLCILFGSYASDMVVGGYRFTEVGSKQHQLAASAAM